MYFIAFLFIFLFRKKLSKIICLHEMNKTGCYHNMLPLNTSDINKRECLKMFKKKKLFVWLTPNTHSYLTSTNDFRF